jgi:regulator of CtrA degradation
MTESEPVNLAERQSLAGRAERIREFVASEMFARAFAEGMALVEETAGYLDTAGREDSKRLSRAGALAYAAESMRLTTRLMNVASWLLVQHSVRQSEMSPDEAAQDKYRLKVETDPGSPVEGAEELPARLRALVERSRQIHDRAQRLDANVYRGRTAANPVTGQIDRLRQAFGG